MDAINQRLRELEDIETDLNNKRKTILQRRAEEDEVRKSQREEENQSYLNSMKERDQEEDVGVSCMNGIRLKTLI